MATNPYYTQLHTQRFSFIGSPQQRDGTYTADQRFLNCYPELIKSPISDGKKYYLKKRPGLRTITVPPAPGEGRGVYYWNANWYSVVGAKVYYGATEIWTLATTDGPVGFTEFEYDTGEVQLIISDGVWLYRITGANVVTTLTGAPSPHLPFPIYLDGYLFVGGVGSGNIYNSNLNDPASTWPADGFISAEMYPDNLVALAKQQNYLVAIGTESIEWFYDNANSTGSPLQRNAPAVTQLGSPLAAYNIVQTEKNLILVASTKNGGLTVWVIEGFQPTEIGNEPVREALDLEGEGIQTSRAFCVQVSGHKFYVLNLKTNQRTFVYDFEEKMWHEWSFGLAQNCFQCDFGSDSPTGYPIVQNPAVGTLYELNPQVYDEVGIPINVVIRTSKIDFDTIMRKRFFRLTLTADTPGGTDPSYMQVSWTDDDYSTYSNPVPLNINSEYPTITQMGISRRRAYQFQYTDVQPMRVESFELNVTQEVRR